MKDFKEFSISVAFLKSSECDRSKQFKVWFYENLLYIHNGGTNG